MAATDLHFADAPLKRTPLFAEHQRLGARLVEFGGWEMPVQYQSIIAEHHAVRTAAGLFDVCHMGEFAVEGPKALEFLQSLVPNNVAKLVEGQALYSQICHPDGGTIDDLLIYYLAPERYLVVVNAGTMEHDWEWFSQHAATHHTGLMLENRSAATALIALQGPRAVEILTTLAETNPGDIRYYTSRSGKVAGIECLISRTGYTGEDGFELYHAADQAVALWQAILQAGQPIGLLPAGLGARDTLRLEAGLCLYGHELTEQISPLEADLGWSVRLKKGVDFVGRAALAQQKEAGVKRIRVGLALREATIARADSVIWHGETPVGTLTSGTKSLTLGYPIGMGYVAPSFATPGTMLTVEVRGKRIPAEVVTMPFYHRPEA